MSLLIYRPHDSRREIWIKNSGNEKLHDIDPTKRRVFCEDHFDAKYLRVQFNRTILRRDAVPFSFDEIQADAQEVGKKRLAILYRNIGSQW